jgi:hypothetical protein
MIDKNLRTVDDITWIRPELFRISCNDDHFSKKNPSLHLVNGRQLRRIRDHTDTRKQLQT